MTKTIFKKDSKGKTRFIRITTKYNMIIQDSGIVGSEKFVTNSSACIAKNVGRANATTPEEQAVLEANAKIKAKLDEGYFETIEEAEQGEVILPMLAKDFKKEEKKVKYPVFIQPKLDGLRMLKKGGSVISRKNKPITTLKHVSSELLNYSDIIFDGEGYSHGDSFQRNMELVKKYRKGETEAVKYHVYDIVDTELNFEQRYAKLKFIIESEKPTNIELVPTFLIRNKEELLEKHKEFLEQGYEGTMIRWGKEGYAINKRSSNLLKFKDFIDIACPIVDVKPSEKRPDQGSFICELPDGRTFGCGMRFSHEERTRVLEIKDEYIGKTAEVRFFEYSTDGIPRFPVCCGIRLDI